MKSVLDVAIIGAGPIGMAAGIEAEKAGFSYLIFDKGCLANSLYHYPLYMTFFSTSEKLEIGGVPFVSHAPKPNRQEALEYYRRVGQEWRLNLRLYEEVADVKKENDIFLLRTSRGAFKAKSLVVATGFYDLPNMMNIPGEDLPKVSHYYKEAHPYFRQKLLIVGAGNSAVDAALECYRKGAEVTMVMMESEFPNSIKYWVKPDIENRIEHGQIRAYFNSSVTTIKEMEVEIETPNGKLVLPNDFVLAMTGYKPNFQFLEHLGVAFNDDEFHTPVYNAETMESNVQDVFLAGVICGGYKTNTFFIENSRVHAHLIMETLKERR